MNLIEVPFAHPDYFTQLARLHYYEYVSGTPFPHVVLDDFLPEAILKEVIQEFPPPGQTLWQIFDNSEEKKLALRDEMQMGSKTRLLLYHLNSWVFLNFLEMLTGIDGLISDPYFGGGGLHQIEPGGFLSVHADFNWHPKLKLDRRLNLLLYLNEDWKEEYGGNLELWNREMSRCERKISPIFNRCVIFNTTDTSYHGHPEPLTCPPGRTRKSIALYYYSNGRPDSEKSAPHSTIFRRTQAEP